MSCPAERFFFSVFARKCFVQVQFKVCCPSALWFWCSSSLTAIPVLFWTPPPFILSDCIYPTPSCELCFRNYPPALHVDLLSLPQHHFSLCVPQVQRACSPPAVVLSLDSELCIFPTPEPLTFWSPSLSGSLNSSRFSDSNLTVCCLHRSGWTLI